MDYELRTILPAIGVIIGWALNELSQHFKSKREDRRLINKSLHSLLFLLLVLNHKKSLLKSALKADKLDGMHLEMLCGLFNDNKSSSDEFKNSLLEAIDRLAEIDPILSQGLTINAESLDIYRKMENTECLDRKALEIRYNALKVFTKQLEVLIRKLLTKHSLFMRLRYEKYKRQMLGDEKVSWDSLFQDSGENTSRVI